MSDTEPIRVPVDDFVQSAIDAHPSLRVDVSRVLLPETGVFVRAIGPRKIEAERDRIDPKSLQRPQDWTWGSWDIVHLTQESLHAWLRSRGGENEWAEGVVYVLLGHR